MSETPGDIFFRMQQAQQTMGSSTVNLGGTIRQVSFQLRSQEGSFEDYVSGKPMDPVGKFRETLSDEQLELFVAAQKQLKEEGYRHGVADGKADGARAGYNQGIRAAGQRVAQARAEGYAEGRRYGANVDQKLAREVVQLTHPDRHPPERQEMATRVTQFFTALMRK